MLWPLVRYRTPDGQMRRAWVGNTASIEESESRIRSAIAGAQRLRGTEITLEIMTGGPAGRVVTRWRIK